MLVLTSRTGAGHDTHARAFCQWAEHLYADRVRVRVEHVLEDSSWLLPFDKQHRRCRIHGRRLDFIQFPQHRIREIAEQMFLPHGTR